jgi:hypothetical protein
MQRYLRQQQAEQTLGRLYEVGRLFTRTLDPTVVGQRLVEYLCLLMRAPNSAVYRLDKASGVLVAIAV